MLNQNLLSGYNYGKGSENFIHTKWNKGLKQTNLKKQYNKKFK